MICWYGSFLSDNKTEKLFSPIGCVKYDKIDRDWWSYMELGGSILAYIAVAKEQTLYLLFVQWI